jgi:hypothetical protein
MLRSGAVLPAILDGFRRTASAPAVLLGTLALTFLFSAPPISLDGSFSLPHAAFWRYGTVVALAPFSGAFYGIQELAAWIVIWAFLSGGIFDRYARNRPTRGRGFFGACGAHFPAMLRLGVVEWLVGLAAVRLLFDYSGYAAIVAGLAASPFFLYARVRIAVEDRRSAIGALLAGGRFIWRNLAAALLALMFPGAAWLLTWWGEKQIGGAADVTARQFIGNELTLTLLLLVVFLSWASAISFFQSRLAHASYTAGPPLEWPESPAAEAIRNLSPSARP